MSDDAIQDLLAELDGIATGDKVSHWTISRARGQHEAHRARVAELTSALEGLRTYVKGERETRFCTSDAIQDLHDQLFMQCLDHAPEYANFIKAAEEQHAATQSTIAELRSALEGRATEVAQLQARAETAEAERSAFVQVMSLQCDHATARAEKAEAECERLRKLVCTCEHCKDAVVTELRAALAGSLEERAALAHEVAEERASVAWLQEKVSRLESAIADQVIADGGTRGG